MLEQIQGGDFEGTGAGAPLNRQTGIVKVRNDSGADAERFHVLGIHKPLFDTTESLGEFQREVMFCGVAPVVSDPAELTDHAGRFVILLEPIPKGQVGRAVVAGVAVCKLAVADPADRQKFADVVDGETILQDAASGAAQVLWAEDNGQDEQWAVVRIGTTGTDGSGGSTFGLTTRNVEGYVGTAGMQQMGNGVKNFDTIGLGGTDASTWSNGGRLTPYPSTNAVCSGVLMRSGTAGDYLDVGHRDIFFNNTMGLTPSLGYIGTRTTNTGGTLTSTGVEVGQLNFRAGSTGLMKLVGLASPLVTRLYLNSYTTYGYTDITLQGSGDTFGSTIMPQTANLNTGGAGDYPELNFSNAFSYDTASVMNHAMALNTGTGLTWTKISTGGEQTSSLEVSMDGYALSNQLTGVGTFTQSLTENGLVVTRDEVGSNDIGTVAIGIGLSTLSSSSVNGPGIFIRTGVTTNSYHPGIALANALTQGTPATYGCPGTLSLTHASAAIPDQTIDLSSISGKTRVYSVGGQLFTVSGLGKKEVGVAQGSAAGQAVIWNGTNYAPGETPYTDGTYTFGGGSTGDVASFTITNGIITGMTFVP